MVRCIHSLFLLLCILSVSAFAQKERSIWYFGEKAGLDFNSGSPVALLNGQILTAEGCAAICNANGQLLFYTEGSTIWDKNGNTMPNGLSLTGLPGTTNTFSTSQASIIVRAPQKKDVYYVLSLTASTGFTIYPGRLYYSLVDMSLNGGLGDVVPGQKGILIDTGMIENLNAVMHANGVFVWVLMHDKKNNYVARLIDATQVGGKVISPVGYNASGMLLQAGCLAISPDGKKIARGIDRVGFELVDFNNATGVASNPIFFTANLNERPYGVSFSPNSKLLYGLDCSQGNMYQWNLLAGSATAISASATKVGKVMGGYTNGSQGGAIQLGPDGKIYTAQYLASFLSVVNAPNVLGIGCNFQVNAVNLQGRISRLGLPGFMQPIYESIVIHYRDTCFGTATSFSITPKEINADSLRWYFGDPASGMQNTAVADSVTHKFTGGGVYSVMLIKYISGYVDTSWATVTIDPGLVPVVDIGADSVMCADSFILKSKNNYSPANYLWSTGATGPQIKISQKGVYWLQITKNECVAADTVNIVINPPAVLDLGNDTSLCPGDTIILSSSLQPGGTSYAWNTGNAGPAILISSPGTYRLTVVDTNACSATDSVAIHGYVVPVINLGADQILCNSQELQLNTNNIQSVWNTGEMAKGITITTSGTYWAYPVHQCPVITDTVHVSYEACEFFFPSAFTPNGDGNNDIARARGSLARFSDYSLRIYNRYGQCVFYTTDIYTGWDGTFKGTNQEVGVYFYTIDYTYSSSLKQYTVKGDLTLIR